MTEEGETEDEDSEEDRQDHPREDRGCRRTYHQRDHQRDPHKVIPRGGTPIHPTDFTEARHKYLMVTALR